MQKIETAKNIINSTAKENYNLEEGKRDSVEQFVKNVQRNCCFFKCKK